MGVENRMKLSFPPKKIWFISEFHHPPSLKANVLFCRCFFFFGFFCPNLTQFWTKLKVLVLCFPDFTENSINVFQIQEEIAPEHTSKFLRTVLLHDACVTMARRTRVSNTQTTIMRRECSTRTHVRSCCHRRRNTTVGS